MEDQSSTSQESALEDIPLDELLRLALQDRLIDLHVALPARVESYNATTQTVVVTPMINRYVPDGDGGYVSETLPQLADVPVKFPRCKQFTISFPLVKGDMGALVFCERNIGVWRATGAQSDSGDVGTHTLDGAYFDPGLMPDALASKTASGANMVIGSETDGNSRIEILPSGGVRLGAGATKGIARVGDPSQIGVPLATWMSQVELFINGVAPGSINPLSTAFRTAPGITIKTGSGNIKAID